MVSKSATADFDPRVSDFDPRVSKDGCESVPVAILRDAGCAGSSG
jgi:hypothetical protein